MTTATSVEAVWSIPDVVPSANRTLGWAVLEWSADNLLQPDGPNYGQPWEFTDEQVRIILRWYSIGDDGKFVYRRGVLRRLKGWGKDPVAAVLAGVELCGPCRFGGWDDNGYPIAIQHPAPWIQNAAVSRDQTRNTMTLFPGLFSKECIAEYKIDIGKELIYARGAGRIEAVTSSPRSLEGGRPSLVIANETHHWLSNNDGLPMAEAIRRNLAKSRDGQARVLEITNAHQPGEGSAAEITYEGWRQGDSDDVYYDAVEAPPIADVRDAEAVRAGLIAARGDSTWLDVDRLVAEIMDPTTPESVTRRFYLNQVFEITQGTWMSADAWAACALPDKVIPDGAEVILGFDGSYNGDSTGLVVCSIEEVPHQDVVACWEKPATEGPDWQVPIEDVEDAIRQACIRWRVKEVDCDPFRWARSIQVLKRERIPMVEYPQTAQRMMPATSTYFEAVMNRQTTHSNDPRLTRHIMNAHLKIDSRGAQLTKDTKQSLRKIDLAVCGVIAFSRARGRKSTMRVHNMAELLAAAEAAESQQGGS